MDACENMRVPQTFGRQYHLKLYLARAQNPPATRIKPNVGMYKSGPATVGAAFIFSGGVGSRASRPRPLRAAPVKSG